MGKDHVLHVDLCVTLVTPFIFTLIQTVKMGWFRKTNSASLMCKQRQTCGSKLGLVYGSRTEAMQKNKNILNSEAAVIHENKRNAAGNSERVVHPCFRLRGKIKPDIPYSVFPNNLHTFSVFTVTPNAFFAFF